MIPVRVLIVNTLCQAWGDIFMDWDLFYGYTLRINRLNILILNLFLRFC